MPRLLSWTAALAVALAPALSRAADELSPPTPADLVRGLRQAGLPDLALEYLEQAGKTAAPDAQLLLTLERARLRVDLAGQETDEVKRDELTTAAAAEFNEFLQKAPKHPRSAEAAVSVAQLDSIQATAQFARAAAFRRAAVNASQAGQEVAAKDAASKAAAEADKARKLFQRASTRFAEAADRLAVSDGPPERKKELARELLQAKLDAAINQYKLALTYFTDQGQGRERGAAMEAALKGQTADPKTGQPALLGFDRLSREDATQPVCWIARAWVAECYAKLDDKTKSDQAFRAITTDHRRVNTEASRAGYRMARFFELRAKFEAANTAAENKAVADAADAWLTDFRSARPTPETFAVQYYRGYALFDQAQAVRAKGMEDAAKAKRTYTLPPDVVQLYRAAEGELKKLLNTDNEYVDRATQRRNQALRMIVGDAVKPAAQYATFDECHMAGMVQYMKLTEAKSAEERTEQLPTTLALLERARQLPIPAESAREAQTSLLMLISVYRMSGRSPEAAVLAEFAMRAARTATAQARFGRQALVSYLESSAKVPGTDPLGKRVDTDRAVAIATFLDKAVPADPVAEEARIILADQLNRDGKPLEALDTFARVTPKAARYVFARLQEGSLAYTLIRPLPADHPEQKKRPKMEPAEKAKLYERAVADLTAVPKPPAGVPAADAMTYLRLQLQLAQLHIAAGGAACEKAEKLVQDARAALPAFTELKPEDRDTIALQAELVRIDAVFEQARVLLLGEKFKEAADRLAPLLAEVANAGPAVKEGQPPAVGQLAARLDANRISFAVVPALNARVRDGDIAKAGELLDVLKKLGGDARRGIAAVFEVVEVTRPQIEKLKKDGKGEEATKLSASVAQLVSKLAEEKNLTPGDNLNLGRAFVQLGEYQKGLALLTLIPKPGADEFKLWGEGQPKKAEGEADDAFKKRFDGWQATAFAVNRYRLATLDRAAALRLSGDLKGCEELLDEVMGKEEPNPKAKGKFTRTGPFAKRPEFRRETFHLLEAKAAATPDAAKATPIWVRAIAEWNDFNGEYRGELLRPEPKDEKARADMRQYKESIRPLFFDTFYEKSRCQLAAFRQVNANNPKALASGLKNIAVNMKKMEDNNGTDFSQPAHVKLADLLAANPDLKTAYQAEGGKMFLARPTEEK